MVLAPLAKIFHRLLGPHAMVVSKSVLPVRCGVFPPRVSLGRVCVNIKVIRLCTVVSARSCCVSLLSEVIWTCRDVCGGGSSSTADSISTGDSGTGTNLGVCTGVLSPSGSYRRSHYLTGESFGRRLRCRGVRLHGSPCVMGRMCLYPWLRPSRGSSMDVVARLIRTMRSWILAWETLR